MIVARFYTLFIAVLAASAAAAQTANVRARADVGCVPTKTELEYDCTIKLANAKTGAPLTGVTVRVGADMPSMAMAHNVKPVEGKPAAEPGVYRARLALEMPGEWALKIDLSGPVRDRVVKPMRFEAK